MSFDEWKERQESLGNEVDSWSAWVFQQAKIDELQKRIDDLMPLLIRDGYLGYANILKGEK